MAVVPSSWWVCDGRKISDERKSCFCDDRNFTVATIGIPLPRLGFVLGVPKLVEEESRENLIVRYKTDATIFGKFARSLGLLVSLVYKENERQLSNNHPDKVGAMETSANSSHKKIR